MICFCLATDCVVVSFSVTFRSRSLSNSLPGTKINAWQNYSAVTCGLLEEPRMNFILSPRHFCIICIVRWRNCFPQKAYSIGLITYNHTAFLVILPNTELTGFSHAIVVNTFSVFSQFSWLIRGDSKTFIIWNICRGIQHITYDDISIIISLRIRLTSRPNDQPG